VQDAAYASLLKSTRQQYHQQVAQMLEARFLTSTIFGQEDIVASPRQPVRKAGKVIRNDLAIAMGKSSGWTPGDERV
jgi:hypothetical protein